MNNALLAWIGLVTTPAVLGILTLCSPTVRWTRRIKTDFQILEKLPEDDSESATKRLYQQLVRDEADRLRKYQISASAPWNVLFDISFVLILVGFGFFCYWTLTVLTTPHNSDAPWWVLIWQAAAMLLAILWLILRAQGGGYAKLPSTSAHAVAPGGITEGKVQTS